MLYKTKIRLSRNLTAQTTPYPQIKTWFRRGFFIFVMIMIAGIYIAAKPKKHLETKLPKEILGEQSRAADASGQPSEMMVYEIKSGDTLFNVSQKYNLSWQTLAKINNLSEPYILRPGQKIKIPTL